MDINKVKIEEMRVFIDNIELKHIESIKIQKNASNPTEVTVKFDALVEEFDRVTD